MACKQVRAELAGAGQQRVQIGRDLHTVLGPGCGLAPAAPGPVLHTNPRRRGDVRGEPGGRHRRRVAKPGFENDRRAAGTAAAEVEACGHPHRRVDPASCSSPRWRTPLIGGIGVGGVPPVGQTGRVEPADGPRVGGVATRRPGPQLPQDRLGVGHLPKTVENHVRNILGKLHLTRRSDLGPLRRGSRDRLNRPSAWASPRRAGGLAGWPRQGVGRTVAACRASSMTARPRAARPARSSIPPPPGWPGWALSTIGPDLGRRGLAEPYQ